MFLVTCLFLGFQLNAYFLFTTLCNPQHSSRHASQRNPDNPHDSHHHNSSHNPLCPYSNAL